MVIAMLRFFLELLEGAIHENGNLEQVGELDGDSLCIFYLKIDLVAGL